MSASQEYDERSTFENYSGEVARQIDWDARSSPVHTRTTTPWVNETVRFVSDHFERQCKIRTTLILHFQKSIRGWRISGTGRQISGMLSSFRVSEGSMSQTGRAYWIEQHHDGREHWKVLVKGTFETTNRFHGVRIYRVGGYKIESMYEVFEMDQLLKSEIASQVPILLQENIDKNTNDEASGVSFVQKENGPVVISELKQNTLFGDSRLAVGMPIVLIDHQRIESSNQAMEVLNASTGVVPVVAFRDESVFDAALASRLMSTILYKDHLSTKTGLTFRKRGDALFISGVKEGSLADEAGLEEFFRVWAINDQSYFETSQAAADYILNRAGYIHLVTDPTGRIDQPNIGSDIVPDETLLAELLADMDIYQPLVAPPTSTAPDEADEALFPPDSEDMQN